MSETITRHTAVDYAFIWTKDGVPSSARRAHSFAIPEGPTVADKILCCGRRPAALLAEMEAADV